jgi:hypothetical protein
LGQGRKTGRRPRPFLGHGGGHYADATDNGGGNGQKVAPGEVNAVSTHPKLS